jgi:hypothetical protein
MLSLFAGQALAESNILDFSFTAKKITSGVPFTVTIKVTNRHSFPVSFDRATFAYVNPDLTFKGPYEIYFGPHELLPGQTVSLTATATIVTTQPSGTLIPLTVSLFNQSISTGDIASFRGTTLTAAKVK